MYKNNNIMLIFNRKAKLCHFTVPLFFPLP